MIPPLSPPEDLDAFWGETEREAREAPLELHRSFSNDFDLPGFVVETFEFAGIDRTLRGWLAYPPGARNLPAFLWVPPYGRESLLPNAYGTREGFVSMSFNFFGHDAFFQEKYLPERGYFGEGAESPETWVFRRMYQDASIAMRLLQAQVEVDAERIGAMGMSQGGGIAVWLGAWNAIVKAICADMPFLSAIGPTLEGTVYRYPLKELVEAMDRIPIGRERVLHTVSYFDTAHVATRCKVPAHVSLGLKDPAARPAHVRALYEALPCEKELVEYDWGHDWHPDMIENNRRWLVRHLDAQ